MKCKDCIRRISDHEPGPIRNKNLVFRELKVEEFPMIRDMRLALNEHIKEAPSFVRSDADDCVRWINKVEAGDRRTFVAMLDGKTAAYVDIARIIFTII